MAGQLIGATLIELFWGEHKIPSETFETHAPRSTAILPHVS